MSALVQDIRFALRLLVRNPGFALVAVITLGLAIGANTTVFSVVDSVLLRPLPYPEPDRLVYIHTRLPDHDRFPISAPEYRELVEHSASFESLGAWELAGSPVSGGAEPVRVHTAYATASLLRTVGVAPALGRNMTDEEEKPHGQTVAILSDRLWRTAFAADPAIVGKTITVDGNPSIVIGVMPRGFAFPRADVDLWMPMGSDLEETDRHKTHWIEVVGRLRPGVSLAQARADLDRYVAWSSATYRPDQHPLSREHPVALRPLADEVIGSARWSLLLLQGAVAFLLLIAAANIASLLLARGDARQREMAIRAAVGADRRRLMRQSLTEALVLGALGAALGLAIAAWGVDLALALLPDSAPRRDEIQMSGMALLVGIGAGLVTSLLFGLLPALRAGGTANLEATLRDAGTRTTATRRGLRLRRALVTGEIALAVVLAVGCGLMTRSFARLQEVELGFEPRGLMTMRIELPKSMYPTQDTANRFWRELRDRTRALPGVRAAAFMTSLPFDHEPAYFELSRPGRGDTLQAHVRGVSDGFADTLGVRITRGRSLEPRDSGGVPTTALVNQRLARALWPGLDPIGRTVPIKGWPFQVPMPTVVGVVTDIHQTDLSGEPSPQFYLPSLASWGDQFADRVLFLVVRAEGDPRSVMPGVRRILRDLDPRIAVADLHTMDDILWQEVARPRFLTVLLTGFAVIALLLAAIGVFATMAHSVAQRTREIGIRMAIGAPPALVRRMVLRDGTVLVITGLVIGLAASAVVNNALSAVLAGVLFEVPPLDPWTFAGVAILIAAVGAVASWIPAARATRIDPTIAMRHD